VRPTLVDFHPLLYLPGSEIADRMDHSRYTTLDDRAINHWCARAAFEYYVLDGGLARVAAHVVRHNPGWLWNLAHVSRYVAEYSGLLRDQRDTKGYL